MSNLLTRALTAVIAGAIAVAAIVLSSYGLMFFCVVVSLAGLWEFYQVSLDRQAYRWAGMTFGALIWAGAVYTVVNGMGLTPLWRFSLLAVPAFGMFLMFQPSEGKPLQGFGSLLLGLFYCYLPLLLLLDLASPDGTYDFRLPLGILVLTWVLDIGAYFAGRFLGKHPLFKRISPKKDLGRGNRWRIDVCRPWVLVSDKSLE